ncbi:MAG: histidine ammonia-lyase [Pelolinea sp.]|nr:histidine ammonia-lyase [Pelolinea sp.]
MVNIDGESLNVRELIKVVYEKEKVAISDYGKEKILKSNARLLKILENKKPVYGLNTGFGIFANQVISKQDNEKLNRNLIISHAVGTGDPLPCEIVRAAMLIRANALTKGYSGVRIEIVQTLVDMLNKDVTPLIYSKGSLGSSGDLCMLAQMALVFSKGKDENEQESGFAEFSNELLSGSEAMRQAAIERLRLSQKEGLALINGATFSAAILALNLDKAEFLCNLADLAISLSLEGLVGKSDPFHPELHQARGLTGQIESALQISRNIQGSTLIDSHPHVQDAYSLRCSPQVHGAVRDTLEFVKQIVLKEINAATDNPLIVEDDKVISGGNFHGEPVGMAADFMSIALSELAAISERRVFRMMDKNLNYGLKEMLVDDSSLEGLNSGLMMLQYTAAALVLENQTLSSPDSVRSLPTSANQEDHNANAYLAAYHTWQIVENVTKVLAIELFSSCRAIEQRKRAQPDKKLGSKTDQAYKLIREYFPYKADDSMWGLDMEKLYSFLLKPAKFEKEMRIILD